MPEQARKRGNKARLMSYMNTVASGSCGVQTPRSSSERTCSIPHVAESATLHRKTARGGTLAGSPTKDERPASSASTRTRTII